MKPRTKAGRALFATYRQIPESQVLKDILAIEAEAAMPDLLEEVDILRARDKAEAAAAPGLDVPPETESVRRCVTHHACDCHMRLAEIAALAAAPERAALDVERLARALAKYRR